MKAILKEINKVTFQVRKTLFNYYIEQCKMIHLVAFMQWRLYFFQSSCKGEEAEERNKLLKSMIDSILDRLFE